MPFPLGWIFGAHCVWEGRGDREHGVEGEDRAWFAVCLQWVLPIRACQPPPFPLKAIWVGVWKPSTKPQMEEWVPGFPRTLVPHSVCIAPS